MEIQGVTTILLQAVVPSIATAVTPITAIISGVSIMEIEATMRIM
jgi:hypothetical protein